MSLINIKNERKLFDSSIVLITAVSAYLTGYLQTLELGPILVAVTLPNIFLIGLTFVHLVIRKGRKFDDLAHKPTYELLKALVFGSGVFTAYNSGISATESFLPQNLIMSLLALILTGCMIYLMAYRPNKN